MAEPIGPGDMVECVRRVEVAFEPHGPPLGSIWVCERLEAAFGTGCDASDDCAAPAIWLVGNISEGSPLCACAFRPISRRSHFETILEQLKRPVPAPTRETEDA